MTENKCYMDSEAKQCCCQCAYHLADNFHCHDTFPDGRSVRDVLQKHFETNRCICGIQRGWICVNPVMLPVAHSNWPEHSPGCEWFSRGKIIFED